MWLFRLQKKAMWCQSRLAKKLLLAVLARPWWLCLSQLFLSHEWSSLLFTLKRLWAGGLISCSSTTSSSYFHRLICATFWQRMVWRRRWRRRHCGSVPLISAGWWQLSGLSDRRLPQSRFSWRDERQHLTGGEWPRPAAPREDPHVHGHRECEAQLRMSGGLCAALLVVVSTWWTLTAGFQTRITSKIKMDR